MADQDQAGCRSSGRECREGTEYTVPFSCVLDILVLNLVALRKITCRYCFAVYLQRAVLLDTNNIAVLLDINTCFGFELLLSSVKTMVAFDIIYPRIVIKWDEDPPRGLPLPYLGQNVMGSLPFVPFSQPPTKSDRKQYDSWIKQHRDKRNGIENDILETVEG